MNLYNIVSPGNILIVCGLMVLIISSCGLCGTLMQSKCLLGLYLSFIIMTMVSEIMIGTYGFFIRGYIRSTLKTELISGVQNKYATNDTSGLIEFWDTVQTKFDCCGIESHKDWYNIAAWPQEARVPSSCCTPIADKTYSSHAVCPSGNRLRHDGCFIRIQKWILEHLFVLAIGCVLFSFVQFFAIASSLLIICTMDFRKQYCPVRKQASDSQYKTIPSDADQHCKYIQNCWRSEQD